MSVILSALRDSRATAGVLGPLKFERAKTQTHRALAFGLIAATDGLLILVDRDHRPLRPGARCLDTLGIRALALGPVLEVHRADKPTVILILLMNSDSRGTYIARLDRLIAEIEKQTPGEERPRIPFRRRDR